LLYEKPTITSLGSIANHTFTNPAGNNKGGGDVWHYDWMAEHSAGSGEDRSGTKP